MLRSFESRKTYGQRYQERKAISSHIAPQSTTLWTTITTATTKQILCNIILNVALLSLKCENKLKCVHCIYFIGEYIATMLSRCVYVLCIVHCVSVLIRWKLNLTYYYKLHVNITACLWVNEEKNGIKSKFSNHKILFSMMLMAKTLFSTAWQLIPLKLSEEQ